jgi:hypothetical protein
VSQPALSVYGFNSQSSPILVVASTTGSATSTAFVIDSNGKIGIGTTSPSQSLSVNGTAYFNGSLLTNVLQIMGIGNNMITSLDSNGNLVATSTPTATAYSATSTTATSTFAGGLNVAGTSGLSVLQNGNVGVGTTSPYRKLSVSGIGAFDSLEINGTTATSTFASGIQTTILNVIGTVSSSTFANGINLSSGCYAIGGVCVGGSNLTGSGSQNKLAYWTSASNINFSSNLNWLESSARLGIGTTTPNWNLQIASSSGSTITLTDTSAVANSKHWSISSIGGNFLIGTSSDNLTSTSSYLSFDSQNYGTYVGRDTGGVNSNSADYAQFNTYVGYGAGKGPSTWISDNNTAVGALSLYKINTAYNNTALGYQALYNNVDGDQNIAIGYNVGPNIVNGSNNILIGSNINAQNDNGMLLNIGNIIFGNNIDGSQDIISSGNVGIGTTSPLGRFSISGGAAGAGRGAARTAGQARRLSDGRPAAPEHLKRDPPARGAPLHCA